MTRRSSKAIKGIISNWLKVESQPFHPQQFALHRALDLNSTEIRVTDIDDLSFRIELWDEPKAGPRYFLVKVSEQI